MKICYLGSELETHLLSTKATLDCLRARGHKIEMRIWHYGKEEKEITFANSDADLFITDGHYNITPPSNILWIQISHGISPYKPWGCSRVDNAIKMRLVPTTRWEKHVTKIRTGTSGVIPADGWSKLDLYHNALRNKEELRAALYKKYKFDPKRPLIVYAPTGARANALTKKEWIAQYGSEKGYSWHGSYYHHLEVRKIVSSIANYYEILHPTISRTDDIKDRVPMMAISDIMIGDISSMSLEYTCVDKPIILLKKHVSDCSPKDFRLFGEDTNPIVDLGDIIGIEELKDVLKYRLKHDDYKNIRRYWKKLLLGTVDGKCGEREADAIEQFWRKHEQ